jgi:hypothetical protein
MPSWWRGMGESHESVPRSWPSAIRSELDRRRAVIHPRGSAVLDLADPGARLVVARAAEDAAASEEGPAVETYDAIVSVGALVGVVDLPLAVKAFDRLLAPGGELFVVEPVSRPGWTQVLLVTAAAYQPTIRGQHLDRDIPLALRSGGFVPTDLERFAMPTRIRSLRRFVTARVIRRPESMA